MKAERFETVTTSDQGPALVESHIALRPGGEALCGAARQKATEGADLVSANCVPCVEALDLYRAVLGTEATL